MFRNISRREWIAMAVMALSTPGHGAGPRLIGFLTFGRQVETQPRLAVFHEAMRSLGYLEGRDYTFVSRYAEGREQLLPQLAAELLALKPELVLASASGAIRALLKETATIPVVSVGTGDPVGAGFAATLARPGRNFTGLSNMNVDTTPKLMEYLLRLAPGSRRVGLIQDRNSSSEAGHLRAARDAAQQLGITLLEATVEKVEEIEPAFAAFARGGARLAVVPATGFTVANARAMAQAALKYRVAAGSHNESLAEEGLALTYSHDRLISFRHAAAYVDKIFKGARAADLPIEQPTQLALAVNRSTLRQLGLSIPKDMLLGVQRFIE